MRTCIYALSCLLLTSCVLVTLTAGELEFYPDGAPETPQDIALTELARYLSTQGHQHRVLQGPRVSPYLSPPSRKKHRLELGQEKKTDLLAALAKKPSLAELLWKEKLGWWIDWNDRGSRDFEYPGHKSSYYDRQTYKDENPDYPLETPISKSVYSGVDLERGMKEEPTMDLHENLEAEEKEEEERKVEETEAPASEFTFRFDDANLDDGHPFAVKPNDPRYYQDAPFFSEEAEKTDTDETQEDDLNWEKTKTLKKDDIIRGREANVKHVKPKEASLVTPSEPDDHTGYHPVVEPVNHDLNNDIYFIAIVAGCSAAAMFALVLISLTWCRLQRGAKAAADIEYPAYGVTGPNKDVSPSGDQRLAQSAQMYHFQHQKQQIIAMENRTSATRDPGSVSEAESDEENEEGDYTVYECPGLASTGEMEVKNPLFHDDPTPATPAQTHKEEDHI